MVEGVTPLVDSGTLKLISSSTLYLLLQRDDGCLVVFLEEEGLAQTAHYTLHTAHYAVHVV